MEREHAPEVKSALPLERELQTELHLTGIESAGSLTKIAAGVLVMRSTAYRSKNEVGVVEHVEGVGVELHTHALRDFENLRQRHISSPVPRTDKRITPQVADTSQTRAGKGDVNRVCGVVPTVCPLIVSDAADTRPAGIRPIV
jgi:hypothetical protein